MAETRQGRSIRPLPSPQVLAIALAIVKSKPPGQQIREHLINLKKHIKEGKSPDLAACNDRHVDGAGFWKEAFQRVEKEQAELRDKLFELERRNDALRAQLRHSQASICPPPIQKKRKNDQENINLQKCNGKRARLKQPTCQDINSGPLDSGPQTVGDPNDPAFAEELNTVPQGTTVLSHFYTMTRLQQRRKMDVSELCMATCALCSAIEVFTASSVLQLNGRPEIVAAFRNQQARSAKKAIISATFNAKRMEDTETAFRCLYRMVPNILKSLDKIGENPDGAHQGGQVAHALIHLFSKFLDYIHSVSLTQAEQAKKKKTARRKTQNAEQCPHNQNGISSKDDFQGQISHFLVILFSCLDMKRSLHSQLLEGLAFVLLSRVGKLLCTFVFDEEYDRDHQSEKTSPRPHINGKNKSQAEIENLARQKDAYYLVVLLKQILPLLGCQSEDVTHQSSRGILVQNAQRRLQSTLVNAIFGSGHEAFQDCFRLPALPKPASSINTPGSVIYDGTEWFQQEIWSLVGWQILCELDDDEDETGHSAKHCESLSKI